MAALLANRLAEPPRTLLTTSTLAPPFFRCALESLPLPALIFEATNRLNFINGPARTFFGLDTSPDAFGWSAEDFFGSDVNFREVDEGGEATVASEHRGIWGERRRVLLCCRKGAPPVKVSAAISSFRPPHDYFTLPPASVSGHVFSPFLPDTGSASPPVHPVAVEIFSVILLDPVLTRDTQVRESMHPPRLDLALWRIMGHIIP
jgi:hypothetical protein